jgi:type VI secretion system protein ImpC
MPEGWDELRADDSSRWLCTVANRAVVAREGVGAAKRVAFTSPGLALAAMLAASFRETRSFARILGAAGSLEAPASWELPAGRDAGTSVPTEAFFSMRTQGALAKLGVLGIGSGRNTTKLMLSEMPMMRASKDAAPLSAQILTGRIARFAQWVRSQVPSGASDAETASLFEEAAKVFLFAGLEEGQASLRAGVGKSDAGARVVEIACRLPAPLAGVPFQMAFQLPL